MRISARSVVKTTVVAILTALVALILGVTQTLTTAITASLGLTAVQAIIVPGTGTPAPGRCANYLPNAVNHYLVPGGDCGTPRRLPPAPVAGIEYDAQFWPIPLPGWGGLQGAKWNVSVQSGVVALTGAYTTALGTGQPIAIFGYSQGATVASDFKRCTLPIPKPSRTEPPTSSSATRSVRVVVFSSGLPSWAPSPSSTRRSGTRRKPIPANTRTARTVRDGFRAAVRRRRRLTAMASQPAGRTATHWPGSRTCTAPTWRPTTAMPPSATPYGYTVEEVQDAIAAASAPNGVQRRELLPTSRATRSTSRCRPGRCRCTSRCSTSDPPPAPRSWSSPSSTSFSRRRRRSSRPATTERITARHSRERCFPRPPSTRSKPGSDLVKDVPLGINNALTPGLQPLPGSDPEFERGRDQQPDGHDSRRDG